MDINQIRLEIVQATDCLSRINALLGESDGSEVVTALPDGTTARLDDWINGHSTVSNDHGAVQYRKVNDYLATLKPEKAKTLPNWFHTESGYTNAKHPNEIARHRCHMNLSNRNFIIMGVPVWESAEYKCEVFTDYSGNFDIPPESRILAKWERGEFLPRHVSWNWDPSVNEDVVLARVVEMANR